MVNKTYHLLCPPYLLHQLYRNQSDRLLGYLFQGRVKVLDTHLDAF